MILTRSAGVYRVRERDRSRRTARAGLTRGTVTGGMPAWKNDGTPMRWDADSSSSSSVAAWTKCSLARRSKWPRAALGPPPTYPPGAAWPAIR